MLGMARSTCARRCVLAPRRCERTSPLKELVRRAEAAGGRAAPTSRSPPGSARVGAGRTASDLLGDDPDDEVADPLGRSSAVYEARPTSSTTCWPTQSRLVVGAVGPEPGRRRLSTERT